MSERRGSFFWILVPTTKYHIITVIIGRFSPRGWGVLVVAEVGEG